jgi:mono/diheme cytochrome c family protein
MPMKKILVTLLSLALAAVAVLAAYLFLRKPDMAPPSAVQVEVTPERVARGRYLYERLANCGHCHGEVETERFGYPSVPGREAAGRVMPAEWQLPGRIAASNLTPDRETGLGAWTDGEILRAIREGVSRDGRALFPLMPYPDYASMSVDDAHALVAYLRSLPAVRNELPKTKLDFPVSVLVTGVPRPVGSVTPPDPNDPVRYGQYVATMGACIECHTPFEKGELVLERRLGGGRAFPLTGGVVVVSANLTPDVETGTGAWSEHDFLEKFRQYREYAEHGSPKLAAAEMTVMPWLGYARLDEEDLKAVYAWLRTVPPLRNAVETRPGAAGAGN